MLEVVSRVFISKDLYYSLHKEHIGSLAKEYLLAEIIFEIRKKEEIKKKYKDIINNIKDSRV